eukprot:646113-Pyramimonas_sp.AAC.1
MQSYTASLWMLCGVGLSDLGASWMHIGMPWVSCWVRLDVLLGHVGVGLHVEPCCAIMVVLLLHVVFDLI